MCKPQLLSCSWSNLTSTEIPCGSWKDAVKAAERGVAGKWDPQHTGMSEAGELVCRVKGGLSPGAIGWWNSVKILTDVQVDTTHSSPLIYQASHFLIQVCQVSQAWLLIMKPYWLVTFLLFMYLKTPYRDEAEVDQSVVP